MRYVVNNNYAVLMQHYLEILQKIKRLLKATARLLKIQMRTTCIDNILKKTIKCEMKCKAEVH